MPPQDTDGVTGLKACSLSIKMAYKVKETVAVDIFRTRVAKAQTVLPTCHPEGHRIPIDLDGSVKRRAGKNSHRNRAHALNINGIQVAAGFDIYRYPLSLWN